MIGSDCRVLERVWFVDLISGDILYTCTGHLKSGFQCRASGILGAALVEEDLVFRNPPSTHTPQLVNFRTGDRDKAFPPIPH